LLAYCVKCKQKREMNNPVAGFNAIGAAVNQGVCPECGTKLYRVGRTPEHDGLPLPEKRGPLRKGKLVIVESPAKAKTIGRFLGKGYTVRASIGHVRDLLRSELSVDVDNNFQPKYRVPNEKRAVVKDLKMLAKQAEEIFLATDPDREGEAIAWHLMEAAQIEPNLSRRVVFHEITEPAIAEAFSHPRMIDQDLVDAQQARRILDRLVGYNLSPLLWEKVRNRLSAGRVQSVALRVIAEREAEIDVFVAQEYWTIEAELRPEKSKSTFKARLYRMDDQELMLSSEQVVRPILEDMEQAEYQITRIKRGERRRKPSAPFITSSMQQESSRKLGFTARRTMAVAQQLYEGLEAGEDGNTGLITYMRTDSTHVAEVAQKEAREFIEQIYGASYLPAEPPQYRTRAVRSQEAHEAVRPTSVKRVPEKVKPFLSPEQFKLYQLIWQRFVASQMEAAVYDTLTVEVSASLKHQYLLRASGSTVKFAGYRIVYEEARDEDRNEEGEDVENTRIPAGIVEGQRQALVRLLPEQHYTHPPPRYTEASLVQVLEEYGIGRPSTYAPILSTIQQRGYVIREAKRLFPTETGLLVNNLVVEYFPEIVDFGFTAQMEGKLDGIADGSNKWADVIGNFYQTFGPSVERARKDMPETKAELEKVGRLCPRCNHDLVIRWGRYGKFISCSTFPDCRHTEAWLEKIGITCPKDGGELVIRKTRKGRVFYGCVNYPGCDFTSWKKPVSTVCPKCSGLMVLANKREVQCTQCEETFLIEQMGDAALESA
jgi:DNA topoisomerase-1